MHQPIMTEQVVAGLAIRPNGRYVDGTLGSGGHAAAILARLGPEGRLWGIDRDGAALERSNKRLAVFGRRFRAIRGDYRNMKHLLTQQGIEAVDGVLLDLGISSEQVDEADRGFSFRQDGPLDMRMDQRQSLTAVDIVNGWPEADLVDLLRRWGEEPAARRVARAIVTHRAERPFRTTGDLSQLLETVLVRKHGSAAGRRHPATRCFQALRMAVNDELAGLEMGLQAALAMLPIGGRMAVISFHSLEDRMVKQFFRGHEGRAFALAGGGSVWEGDLPAMKRVNRKACKPTEAECRDNPRSRSARLRVAERVEDPVRIREEGQL